MALTRPPVVRLNKFHWFAQDLLLFGGGSMAGTEEYIDSSLYRNTCTLTAMNGAEAWVRDIGRSGLNFVTDDRVVVPHSSWLSLPDQFSIGLWLDSDVTNYAANSYVFGAWENATDKRQFSIYIPSATDKISVITSTNGGSVNSGSVDTSQSVQAGLHHIQFNVTNSTKAWEFYYDGTYVQTITAYGTFLPLGSLWTIGGLDGTGNTIDGRIYDPTVHARHLSGPEIRALADDSNTMLSGGLQQLRRKWWPVLASQAAGAWPAGINCGGIIVAC